jgi:hypothetical protein
LTSARNGDALLLAAGQLLGQRVEPVLQTYPLERLIGRPPLMLDRLAQHAPHERHVLEHRLGTD